MWKTKMPKKKYELKEYELPNLSKNTDFTIFTVVKIGLKNYRKDFLNNEELLEILIWDSQI